MNGRVYDPILGRFLSPDNYIQLPDFTQSFNRFSYAFNNPLKYTDPSGEYVLIDDIIAAAVGGVVNLTVNALQGNLSGYGFWGGVGRGLAAFGAGAVGGVGAMYPEFGGWIWGGATVGATNAWLGGATSATDIIAGGAIGALAGVAGGIAGQYVVSLSTPVLSSIASPVLRGVIGGAVGGAAGGYVGGFIGGMLTTGDFNEANKAGLSSMVLGTTLGGVMGGGYGYKNAVNNGFNPWTGEIQFQTQIRSLKIDPLITPEDLLNNFNFEPNGIDDMTFYRGMSGNENVSKELYLTTDYDYAKVYSDYYGTEVQSITIPRGTNLELQQYRLIKYHGTGQHISNPYIRGSEYLIQNQGLKTVFLLRLKP